MRKKSAVPSWNLAGLYAGIDDPKIAADTATVLSDAEKFERDYRDAVKTLARTPGSLLPALQQYERLLETAAALEMYAYLLFSCNTADHEYGAFLQQVRKTAVTVQQRVLFFELELLALPAAAMQRLVSAKPLRNYHHFLHKLQVRQPHRLSEPEEKILADKGLTSREAFTRLFEQETTSMRFTMRDGKRRREYDAGALLRMQYHPQRQTRKQAARALTAGLKQHGTRLAYIYSMLIEDQAIEDRYRHFPTPEAARHLSNETDEAAVAAMVTATVEQYPLAQQYFRLKKKVLGYDVLYDYDRHAPVGKTHRRYSYAQARRLIQEAFVRLSPDFAGAAEEFFDKGWIDARPRPGKQAGAYCMYNTPATHPVVLLNYGGDIESVDILAHELGHGVHASLARQQSWLNFDWPQTLAETASTFAEFLLFDALKDQLTDAPHELLTLYMGKLDRMVATIFRQVSMFRFEQKVHSTHREHGELSVLKINALWRQTQVELHGTSITHTSDYDWWWSYIPHFMRTPFYVYSYAFGDLLASALYQRHLASNGAFAAQYLDMLRQGGAKAPHELVAELGIDLHDPQFWHDSFTVFRELLAETKRLAKKARGS